ncbi:MAG TPA: hypothetical protein VJM46_04490 [Candidatus Saccharimonadales bacterium]|nr:hypothetical protein [Candidatus Saccharimonadales bacterium]
MSNPPVTVTEIPLTEATHSGGSGPNVNLGDRAASARLNQLLGASRAQPGTRAFLLSWSGGKIPRGAQVGSHTVAWTQNGVVNNTNSRQIGTYDRLVENGGAGGNEQRMLVFLHP